MRILVRVYVVLLALGGIGGAVLAAQVLHEVAAHTEEVVCNRLRVPSMEDALKHSEVFVPPNSLEASQIQELNNVLDGYLARRQAIWFLYGASALGLFGLVLALRQRGKSAAAVLLAAAAGPALVLPLNALPGLMMVTAALPMAGLLALLIRRPKEFKMV
jgi:hypothetical protein